MKKGPISYIGSKYKLWNKIKEKLPNTINNYYEPFLGSGVVFLNIVDEKTPIKCFLNDIDVDITNIFKQLRSNCNGVISLLELLEKNKNKTTFNKLKTNYNKMDTKNKAAAYIMLNKLAFNNRVYKRKDGEINPIYSGRKSSIYDKDILKDISKNLKNVKISNTDYKDFFQHMSIRKGDFVFLDPPYLVRNVKEYYTTTFSEEDFEDMFQICEMLDKKNVNWMITVNSDPFLIKLFKGFKIQTITKPNTMNISKKKTDKELIITNY